ncbi:MAG: hypothetical protein V4857_08390 [Pseudomonadota bacterium]
MHSEIEDTARCCHCRLGALDVHVRARAISQQLARVESGRRHGAKVLLLGAGACGGQGGPQLLYDRYLDSMRIIYSALPADWVMVIERHPCAASRGAAVEDWTVEIGSRFTFFEDLDCDALHCAL